MQPAIDNCAAADAGADSQIDDVLPAWPAPCCHSPNVAAMASFSKAGMPVRRDSVSRTAAVLCGPEALNARTVPVSVSIVRPGQGRCRKPVRAPVPDTPGRSESDLVQHPTTAIVMVGTASGPAACRRQTAPGEAAPPHDRDDGFTGHQVADPAALDPCRACRRSSAPKASDPITMVSARRAAGRDGAAANGRRPRPEEVARRPRQARRGQSSGGPRRGGVLRPDRGRRP